MKDRKTRIKEIHRTWYDNSQMCRKQFWKRRDLWGCNQWCADETMEDYVTDLEGLLEAWGYNEIFKQHVMAYRIINRWKSARVNPNCELGRRKMEHDMISAGI